jgi:hypothetical protein
VVKALCTLGSSKTETASCISVAFLAYASHLSTSDSSIATIDGDATGLDVGDPASIVIESTGSKSTTAIVTTGTRNH